MSEFEALRNGAKGRVAILGAFVADTAYRAARQPAMGETLLASGFALGPGGKGSNQAVAAARAGAEVAFISRLGDDAFGALARETWTTAGVRALVPNDPESYTGAAYIFVEDGTGANAIIVAPGAAMRIAPADLDAAADEIRGAQVFLTQLEQPVEAARRGLAIAREAGVATILNPAPAVALDDAMLALCDVVTPNETEVEALTGVAVATLDDAARAADALRARGARAAIITLGERGAFLSDGARQVHAPAVAAGPVVETTGAGDAFNGGFAAALAAGLDTVPAMRFGCVVAGISVTRPGTAPSMPSLKEALALATAAD